MAYSLGNLNGILRTKFHPKLIKAINDEALMFKLAKENPYTVQGQNVQATIQTGFDTSGAFIQEGGALPLSGNRTQVVAQIAMAEYAHRFQISTRAKEAGAEVDPDGTVLINALMYAKDGVKEGAIQRMDVATLWGGSTKAYLNELKAHAAVAAGGPGIAQAGVLAWEASFDVSGFNPFAACVQATPATWVRVNLRRMDTYALIGVTLAGGAATSGIFVSAFDPNLMTLTLSLVADGAGGGSNFTTVPVAGDFAIAVQLATTNPAIGVVGVVGTTVDFANEPLGIADNLSLATWLTIDRTTATGGVNAILQANCLTVATVAPRARAALTPQRIQFCFDRALNRAKKEPNFLLCSPLMRSVYVTALTTNTRFDVQKKGMADFVPETLQMHGLVPKVAHNCPRGMIVFGRTDNWLYETYGRDPGFLEMSEGSYLMIANGSANYEGLFQAWYNLFTDAPQGQTVLCGINI